MAKRFYHGHEFRDTCPKCGTERVKDEDDYLSYPMTGKAIDLNFYCDECEHEWTRKIFLTINIREVPQP